MKLCYCLPSFLSLCSISVPLSSAFCLLSLRLLLPAGARQLLRILLIACVCVYVSESVIGVLWGCGSDVALCSLRLNGFNKQISNSPGKRSYLQPAGCIPTGRAHVSQWLVFFSCFYLSSFSSLPPLDAYSWVTGWWCRVLHLVRSHCGVLLKCSGFLV